jgi:hypothetical protein
MLAAVAGHPRPTQVLVKQVGREDWAAVVMVEQKT